MSASRGARHFGNFRPIRTRTGWLVEDFRTGKKYLDQHGGEMTIERAEALASFLDRRENRDSSHSVLKKARIIDPRDELIEIPDESPDSLGIVLDGSDESGARRAGSYSGGVSDGREPWFYGFLEGWGKFYLFTAWLLGVVVGILIVLSLGIMLLASEDFKTAFSNTLSMSILWFFVIQIGP